MHLGKKYVMLSLELPVPTQEREFGVFTQLSTVIDSVFGDNQEVNHQKRYCYQDRNNFYAAI